MLNAIRSFVKRRILNQRLDREKTKWILLRLHYAGGCDADDPWSVGWDEAIDFAIETIEQATGVYIKEALRGVSNQEAVEHQERIGSWTEDGWKKDE